MAAADPHAKVLLVEDNELNRDMLGRRLARHGFKVAFASDGYQALIAAELDPPELVLMDLSLPGLDGWEAVRRLKANAQTRAIPVIVLTANAMTEDRDKAMAAGCNGFETKPINFANLLGRIDRLLP